MQERQGGVGLPLSQLGHEPQLDVLIHALWLLCVYLSGFVQQDNLPQSRRLLCTVLHKLEKQKRNTTSLLAGKG